LTPHQNALLRRVGDGLGLPAYILRPRNCAQDVELLCALQFVAADSGELSITPAGIACLRELDSGGSERRFENLRVAHARDQSIMVEYWPQEF